MSFPEIESDGPCSCKPGQCAAFVGDDADCINRLDGDVRTHDCLKCGSMTWHHNGACLRCKAKAEGKAPI